MNESDSIELTSSTMNADSSSMTAAHQGLRPRHHLRHHHRCVSRAARMMLAVVVCVLLVLSDPLSHVSEQRLRAAFASPASTDRLIVPREHQEAPPPPPQLPSQTGSGSRREWFSWRFITMADAAPTDANRGSDHVQDRSNAAHKTGKHTPPPPLSSAHSTARTEVEMATEEAESTRLARDDDDDLAVGVGGASAAHGHKHGHAYEKAMHALRFHDQHLIPKTQVVRKGATPVRLLGEDLFTSPREPQGSDTSNTRYGEDVRLDDDDDRESSASSGSSTTAPSATSQPTAAGGTDYGDDGSRRTRGRRTADGSHSPVPLEEHLARLSARSKDRSRDKSSSSSSSSRHTSATRDAFRAPNRLMSFDYEDALLASDNGLADDDMPPEEDEQRYATLREFILELSLQEARRELNMSTASFAPPLSTSEQDDATTTTTPSSRAKRGDRTGSQPPHPEPPSGPTEDDIPLPFRSTNFSFDTFQWVHCLPVLPIYPIRFVLSHLHHTSDNDSMLTLMYAPNLFPETDYGAWLRLFTYLAVTLSVNDISTQTDMYKMGVAYSILESTLRDSNEPVPGEPGADTTIAPQCALLHNKTFAAMSGIPILSEKERAVLKRVGARVTAVDAFYPAWHRAEHHYWTTLIPSAECLVKTTYHYDMACLRARLLASQEAEAARKAKQSARRRDEPPAPHHHHRGAKSGRSGADTEKASQSGADGTTHPRTPRTTPTIARTPAATASKTVTDEPAPRRSPSDSRSRGSSPHDWWYSTRSWLLSTFIRRTRGATDASSTSPRNTEAATDIDNNPDLRDAMRRERREGSYREYWRRAREETENSDGVVLSVPIADPPGQAATTSSATQPGKTEDGVAKPANQSTTHANATTTTTNTSAANPSTTTTETKDEASAPPFLDANGDVTEVLSVPAYDVSSDVTEPTTTTAPPTTTASRADAGEAVVYPQFLSLRGQRLSRPLDHSSQMASTEGDDGTDACDSATSVTDKRDGAHDDGTAAVNAPQPSDDERTAPPPAHAPVSPPREPRRDEASMLYTPATTAEMERDTAAAKLLEEHASFDGRDEDDYDIDGDDDDAESDDVGDADTDTDCDEYDDGESGSSQSANVADALNQSCQSRRRRRRGPRDIAKRAVIGRERLRRVLLDSPHWTHRTWQLEASVLIHVIAVEGASFLFPSLFFPWNFDERLLCSNMTWSDEEMFAMCNGASDLLSVYRLYVAKRAHARNLNLSSLKMSDLDDFMEEYITNLVVNYISRHHLQCHSAGLTLSRCYRSLIVDPIAALEVLHKSLYALRQVQSQLTRKLFSLPQIFKYSLVPSSADAMVVRDKVGFSSDWLRPRVNTPTSPDDPNNNGDAAAESQSPSPVEMLLAETSVYPNAGQDVRDGTPLENSHLADLMTEFNTQRTIPQSQAFLPLVRHNQAYYYEHQMRVYLGDEALDAKDAAAQIGSELGMHRLMQPLSDEDVDQGVSAMGVPMVRTGESVAPWGNLDQRQTDVDEEEDVPSPIAHHIRPISHSATSPSSSPSASSEYRGSVMDAVDEEEEAETAGRHSKSTHTPHKDSLSDEIADPLRLRGASRAPSPLSAQEVHTLLRGGTTASFATVLRGRSPALFFPYLQGSRPFWLPRTVLDAALRLRNRVQANAQQQQQQQEQEQQQEEQQKQPQQGWRPCKKTDMARCTTNQSTAKEKGDAQENVWDVTRDSLPALSPFLRFFALEALRLDKDTIAARDKRETMYQAEMLLWIRTRLRRRAKLYCEGDDEDDADTGDNSTAASNNSSSSSSNNNNTHAAASSDTIAQPKPESRHNDTTSSCWRSSTDPSAVLQCVARGQVRSITDRIGERLDVLQDMSEAAQRRISLQHVQYFFEFDRFFLMDPARFMESSPIFLTAFLRTPVEVQERGLVRPLTQIDHTLSEEVAALMRAELRRAVAAPQVGAEQPLEAVKAVQTILDGFARVRKARAAKHTDSVEDAHDLASDGNRRDKPATDVINQVAVDDNETLITAFDLPSDMQHQLRQAWTSISYAPRRHSHFLGILRDPFLLAYTPRGREAKAVVNRRRQQQAAEARAQRLANGTADAADQEAAGPWSPPHVTEEENAALVVYFYLNGTAERTFRQHPLNERRCRLRARLQLVQQLQRESRMILLETTSQDNSDHYTSRLIEDVWRSLRMRRDLYHSIVYQSPHYSGVEPQPPEETP